MKRLILLILILLYTSCGQRHSGRISPKAVNGIIDLSSWNFEKDGPIDIRGEWKFYWKTFIDPNSLKDGVFPDGGKLVKAPGSWFNEVNSLNKKKVNKTGYATYILKIKGLKIGEDLSVYCSDVAHAASIFYLNQGPVTKKVFSHGLVSKEKEKEVPQRGIFKFDFNTKSNEIFLIYHLSNFNYRTGKLGAYTIGKKNIISRKFLFIKIRDFFSIGILFIIAIYHFGLFSQRTSDLGFLYFGLFCTTVLLRQFVNGSYSPLFFPEPSKILYSIGFKIEYLSLVLGISAFIYFLDNLFETFSIKIKKLSLYSSIPLSIIIIITPTYFFTQKIILNIIQANLILQMFWAIFELIRSSSKGNKNALLVLIGCTILASGVFHDIGVTHQIFSPPFIFSYCFLTFILIQSLILSSKFSKDYSMAKKLSTKLGDLVTVKTKKIESQYEDFKTLLFNLDQGFLIFGKEGLVKTESTKITKDLFLLDPINKKIEDILQLNAMEKQNFKKWIGHVYKGVIPFKDLTKLAPQSFEKIQGKHISLEYKPIYKSGQSKKIDKIICIATDITERIKFEKEAEVQRKKAQRLTNILERPLEFLDLMSDIDDTFKKYSQNLRYVKPSTIFRDFHTLKARFGSFQLDETVQNIHELESFLNEIEDNWNPEYIAKTLSLIDKTQFNHSEFIRRNRRLIEVANNSLDSSEDSINPNALIKKIKNDYANFHKEFILKELSVLFKKFISPTMELAKQQDKLVDIKLNTTDIFIDPTKYKKVFASFLHIFRNSIDHGIESREERIDKNKSEIANLIISAEFFKDDNNFKVLIKDDGKGIDPKVIRSIAKEKKEFKNMNLDTMPGKKIINLIFESGFSSKEETTKISGRGIGMDAVKNEIEKIGGQIKVMSKVDVGTTFEITLPLFK